MVGPLGVSVAQSLHCFQLGGVAYTHSVAEGGHLLKANVITGVFFVAASVAQLINGVLSSPGLILACHGTALAAGFGVGYVVSSFGARAPWPSSSR